MPESFKIAICSDTHIGHKTQQLTALRSFYKTAKAEGCQIVLHAGDLLDGMSMRKGHEYECFISGTDDLLDYVEDIYPDECETWLIGGNHDFSYFKHSQTDILKIISRLRPDVHYLGMHKAAFRLGDFEIAMFHGTGAGAASNRLARTYNNACRDGPRPDLVINGHLHHWNLWPDYGKQKALLVQMACFQGTTIFDTMTDKTPQIGGMIIWRDECGKIEFKRLDYEEREGDYP